ncbi:MAG TPA: transglutaminaseTgpA domain-containing protein, partial [Ktedonobacteraceae bacterium]|nr:transglutaminaseTgpA domain-containing protein [Ktedonobacteraceae bacterium]
MRDAAIERLSKIIADRPTDDGSGKGFRSRRPAFEVHLGLAEGWFSLFLLATVVYSTIWSVQAVGWVEHLNVLTLTTALGLLVGVLAAKQRRLAHLPVHIIALGCGLLLAFWQTAGAFYGGNTTAFVHGIQRWLTIVLAGGVGDDDSIFLFFIVALSFVLAYTSAWLLYRTRNPWLMIVANAVVLLINLSNVDAGFVVFLIVFLMASLLLVLRFNLYESVRRWKRQGLRYSDDIGWDVMQAGAMISIALLVFSWVLPWGYTDPTLSQVWNANANPWVQLENTWNRVISVNGGVNPANRGNFRDALILAGNPNLNHDVVLTVQSDDESQYLEFLNYDTYTGRGWTNSPTGTQVLKANQVF